ncbi:MAG: cell division protein ZapA [Flavipsychrobacter sp.]|nr:cell division protein ZapA [Flavipsychrobacter sp.]
MADEELIPVTVWLAGRSYRIRIKPHEEEAVRKAVKLADEKVMDMRRHYAGKDDQDFLAMSLLTYAADIATGETSEFTRSEIGDMIARIDQALQG